MYPAETTKGMQANQRSKLLRIGFITCSLPIPTRASFQAKIRPIIEPITRVAILCKILPTLVRTRVQTSGVITHVPRVIPARPFTFCGLSLSPEVKTPVLI